MNLVTYWKCNAITMSVVDMYIQVCTMLLDCIPHSPLYPRQTEGKLTSELSSGRQSHDNSVRFSGQKRTIYLKAGHF